MDQLLTRDTRRFWSKIDFDGPVVRPDLGPCWLWTASTDDWGYGQFPVRWDGISRSVKAHRYAYEMCVGPIPPDQWVLHHCDNPACVRPSHLHLGTHQTNMDEMYERGRGGKARGERHPQAKLTEDQVREIRRRYAAGEQQIPLAKEFGMAQQIVSQIVNRKLWKHVE